MTLLGYRRQIPPLSSAFGFSRKKEDKAGTTETRGKAKNQGDPQNDSLLKENGLPMLAKQESWATESNSSSSFGQQDHHLEQKQPITTCNTTTRGRSPIRAITCRWSKDRFQKVVELWNLSLEEQDRLHELQHRISDVDHWKNDPIEAIRFLKEKRGNVAAAEKLLRRVVQWRLDNQVDTFLETYHLSPMFNYFPIANLQGVDKDGDPIHIVRVGAADCWGFYQRFGADAMFNMCLYMQETNSRRDVTWQRQYKKQYQRPVKYFTIIIDLQGLSTQHMRPGLLPLLNRILKMLQDNYPFFAKRVIFLRAPAIFKLIWSISHHFLTESIKNLIIITSQHDYKEVLDRYIDREVLPPCIFPNAGKGKGTFGFENIRFEGGPLPEEYEELYTATPHFLADGPVGDNNVLSAFLQEDNEAKVSEKSPPAPTHSKPLLVGRIHESSEIASTVVNVSCENITKGFWVGDDETNIKEESVLTLTTT